MFILICWFLLGGGVAAQQCSIFPQPVAELSVTQESCVANNIVSPYGEKFERHADTMCEPHNGENGEVWHAAYPGVMGWGFNREGILYSTSLLNQSMFHWMQRIRPINLTFEVTFSLHRGEGVPRNMGNTTALLYLDVTGHPISASDLYARSYFRFGTQVQGFNLINAPGTRYARFTGPTGNLEFLNYWDDIMWSGAYEIYPNPSNDIVKISEIMDEVRWHNPMTVMMTFQNGIQGLTIYEEYWKMNGHIYYNNGTYISSDGSTAWDLVEFTKPTEDDVYDYGPLDTITPRLMKSYRYDSRMLNINRTFYSFAMWDIALDRDQIMERLLLNPPNEETLPVVRNGSVVLPQGGANINLTSFVFDADGDPVGSAWILEELPIRGNLYLDGVFIETPGQFNGTNFTYIPHSPYDFNLVLETDPCEVPYDLFKFRAFPRSPLPGILGICLFDIADHVIPLNSTIQYQKSTLVPFDVTYFDPDEEGGENSTSSGTVFGINLILKNNAGTRTRLVQCDTLFPVLKDTPHEMVLGEDDGVRHVTNICIQSSNADYFDLGDDLYEFWLEDSHTTGWVTVRVTSPITLPPALSFEIFENQDNAFEVPWNDTIGEDGPTLHIEYPGTTVTGPKTAQFQPPLDYFNKRTFPPFFTTRTGIPLKHSNPLIVPYSVALNGQTLVSGTIEFWVLGVFSPIRESPQYAIPGSFPLIPKSTNPLPKSLLIVEDPDEGDYDLGVYISFSSSSQYAIFPQLGSALQYHPLLVFGECAMNVELYGCTDLTLVGPTQLVNEVLSKMAIRDASSSRANSSLLVEFFKPYEGIPPSEANGDFIRGHDANHTFITELYFLGGDSTNQPSGTKETFGTVFLLVLKMVGIVILCLVVICSPCLLACAGYMSVFYMVPCLARRCCSSRKSSRKVEDSPISGGDENDDDDAAASIKIHSTSGGMRRRQFLYVT